MTRTLLVASLLALATPALAQTPPCDARCEAAGLAAYEYEHTRADALAAGLLHSPRPPSGSQASDNDLPTEANRRNPLSRWYAPPPRTFDLSGITLYPAASQMTGGYFRLAISAGILWIGY